MKKDLLNLLDLPSDDITLILDTADMLKSEQKSDKKHDFPSGKTLAMIFAKSSTRTRVSFEVGIFQLGGQGIFLSNADSQLGRGEPIADTARVLSRYCDCIMIRTFDQSEVEALAEHATIPVINGLTDFEHPCQVLADIMTIREHKGQLEGLKACWIGDGNNVANSMIVGCLKCGMDVSVACPEGYRPDKQILDFAHSATTGKFELTDKPEIAAQGADVIFTDVWASMGQESETQKRQKAFTGYQVNDEIMALANPGCMIQHCLPAHKGEEITEKVFEAHAQEIFDEAENRLHVQKAIMYLLMKNK
ncbi:MAG: ornithine carbamoyltransferase [Oscillospiraceae bacterium]|nr:ornithine carbamoyltransferase [Oscillospiraceae bacterium]